MPRRKDPETVKDLYLAHSKTLEHAKALYDEADRLLKKLRQKMRVKVPVRINDQEAKNAIVLVNNFVGVDKVWAHGAARKWEIKLVTIE
jgi:hypothetical protein